MKKLKIAGYARVSTEEQKKFGFSISAQTKEIEAWCKDNEHTLMQMYIDKGYSASNLKRPAIQDLLNNLNHYDAIAFTRLDRLSRSVLEANKLLATFQENNVAMISICEDDINTSTANGLFMFNLKVNLAEHELKKGSERIKSVFEYKVAQGQPITGSVPFGYKIATENGKKKVVKDEKTSPIIDDIFESFLLHHSIHKTVDFVNNKYDMNRPYISYRRILGNEFYAGVYRGNSSYCDPYISQETFSTVQAMLKANVRTGVNRYSYLFTSLVRCPVCRSRMVGISSSRNGKRYYYYRCNNAYATHTCSHKHYYSELVIETFVLSNIETLVADHVATVKSVRTVETDNSEKELKRLSAERDNLTYAFIKGRMSASVYDSMYADIEAKIKALQAPKKDNSAVLQKLLNSDWKNMYDAMNRDSKRSLWRNVIDEIGVQPYSVKFL